MDCQRFAVLLDCYADLTDEQIKEIEEHAMNCEQCRAELDFYRSVIETTASLPTSEPPADLLSRINDEIDKQNAHIGNRIFNSITTNIRVNIRRYATVAACLLVGVVVGLNSDMINDRLNGNDDGGVISESVSKIEETEVPENKTVPETEAVPAAVDTATQAPKDSASTEAAQTDSPNESEPETAQSSAKAEDNSKTTQRQNNYSASENTDALPSPASTVKPTQRPSSATQSAAPVAEPQSEPASTSGTDKYVMAQEYHMPDEYASAGETQIPENENTEQPGVESYSIADTDTQSEYSYAGGTEPARAAARVNPDQLIISTESLDEVLTIMNALDIENTGVAYVASISTFYTLLDKLEAAGVTYSYSQNSESDKVSFKIILI